MKQNFHFCCGFIGYASINFSQSIFGKLPQILRQVTFWTYLQDFFARLKQFKCGLELLLCVLKSVTIPSVILTAWFFFLYTALVRAITVLNWTNTDAGYSCLSIKSTEVRIRADNTSISPILVTSLPHTRFFVFVCYSLAINYEDTNKSDRITSLSLLGIKK